jgi:unsaturated rhamnogalacturonyl hydrolase
MALIGTYKATGDMSYVEDFADQIIAHAEHLYDPQTGFWFHGWAETSFPAEDACSQYGWNVNKAHRNNEFWGRGNGWIAMSLADVLEVLPSSDARYARIKAMYEQMMKTLLRLQDRRTGLWRQLPLHVKDKANFLESSGTAMFGYALAKGVRIGALPADHLKAAQKAYDGLVEHCLLDVGTPQIRLGRICAGTCIGDKEYYYARSQVDRAETYAVGAMLLLANELK